MVVISDAEVHGVQRRRSWDLGHSFQRARLVGLGLRTKRERASTHALTLDEFWLLDLGESENWDVEASVPDVA